MNENDEAQADTKPRKPRTPPTWLVLKRQTKRPLPGEDGFEVLTYLEFEGWTRHGDPLASAQDAEKACREFVQANTDHEATVAQVRLNDEGALRVWRVEKVETVRVVS